MTLSGILLLGGFVLFAALMVARILPTLLALPLMAGWIAFNAGASALTLAKNFILAVLSVPGSLISVIGKLFSQKKSTLIKKKETLPGAALITPILPLVVIGIINFTLESVE